jgi:hypothetical protein
MISFKNRRLQKIEYIKNMQNRSEQIRLINLARNRKNKASIQNISDSESVFDETSSVYDDMNSVNSDFGYLNDDVHYNNNNLGTIMEEGPKSYLYVNVNTLSNFKKHLLKLELKYRNTNK